MSHHSIITPDIFLPFSRISLEEMEKVRLMNRIDTKFVAPFKHVESLLDLAVTNYMVQEIDGKCDMPYYTCYYDTEDVDMFYQHQRGRKTRQKIRIRQYEGTMDFPFLEIKHKNNKGRTRKKRVLMEESGNIGDYKDFLEKHSFYTPELLTPQIENHFFRITLVNKDMTERITIDTDIEFHNLISGEYRNLKGIGIIEWKRDGQSCKSGLDKLLRALHIHESSFSKYCIGMAMTNELLRQNRVKPKIRMIERMNNSLKERV